MGTLNMTNKEREVYDALLHHKDGFIREHTLPSGTRCYRHLDARRNPLANYRHDKVMSLLEKGILTISSDQRYTLKEDSGNAVPWSIRKY